jgi:hypothetical protein
MGRKEREEGRGKEGSGVTVTGVSSSFFACPTIAKGGREERRQGRPATRGKGEASLGSEKREREQPREMAVVEVLAVEASVDRVRETRVPNWAKEVERKAR